MSRRHSLLLDILAAKDDVQSFAATFTPTHHDQSGGRRERMDSQAARTMPYTEMDWCLFDFYLDIRCFAQRIRSLRAAEEETRSIAHQCVHDHINIC